MWETRFGMDVQMEGGRSEKQLEQQTQRPHCEIWDGHGDMRLSQREGIPENACLGKER